MCDKLHSGAVREETKKENLGTEEKCSLITVSSITGLREVTEVAYFGVGRRIVGPQPEEARKKQLEQEAVTMETERAHRPRKTAAPELSGNPRNASHEAKAQL